MEILRVLAEGTGTSPIRFAVRPDLRSFRYQLVWKGSASHIAFICFARASICISSMTPSPSKEGEGRGEGGRSPPATPPHPGPLPLRGRGRREEGKVREGHVPHSPFGGEGRKERQRDSASSKPGPRSMSAVLRARRRRASP